MASPFELIKVCQRLSFSHDLDSIIAILPDAARDLTGADGVTVVLRDGDQCYYTRENAIAPLWSGRRFPIDSCISGWCMLHRQKVAIADIYADPRVPHDAYRPTFVKSLAMVPIRSEEPLGAIGAYWASNHQATEAELEILQSLADSASMAIANAKLIESLEQSNRRKDEFLAMLGHELRNPLAPALSALYAIGRKPGDITTVQRMHQIMERQVQHMSRILDGLLDVSCLTSGKIALKRERLDIARLIRETAEDRRAVIEAAGLALQLHLPDTPIWVVGDNTRLVQAISNVLDNAVKFTPGGGNVAVRLTLENKAAVVSIRDSGIGIDTQTLPAVFDWFTQADRPLDRARGGLGLGLSITKNLLELHGGSIEASSQGTGKGAEFVLRLPYERELPALTGNVAISSKPVGSRLQILVVEDNPDAAHVLRMLLELSGYDVTLARTGPEGLAAAKARRPEVVLCDIGLPGMDGYAVATALRQDPETAAARLIAVTAYGLEEDRRRALAAGFDAHLVKPVDPDKLLQHLTVA